MKKYRVEITMTEYGFVDIEAPDDASEAEIRTLADEANSNGDFIGTNSEGSIGSIISNE